MTGLWVGERTYGWMVNGWVDTSKDMWMDNGWVVGSG